MYTSRLTSALLFSTLAHSAALFPRADQGKTVWKAPNDGNTRVVFGDEKVYVGSCTPEMIVDSMGENCYEEGFCNSKSWTMQCTQGDNGGHTITITAPEGQYQPSMRQGLIDALRAAVTSDGVFDKKTITAASGGGCVGCSFTARKIDTYHMPASIGISHLNSGSVPDVMTLNIVNNDDEENAGLCEILMGIGGAIAGSVNGVAGGAFSVGSVACKAI